MRLAIVLLFTSGLRRGELLRLTLGDFNAAESTLFIRSTKFHKERIIPLSATADAELRTFISERQRRGFSIKESSPIIWNNAVGAVEKAYTGTGLAQNWRILCASLKILTPKGVPPRIHDIRHSFAVNALLRWYHNDENVMAKLPQLSTYMGMPVSFPLNAIYPLQNLSEPLQVPISNKHMVILSQITRLQKLVNPE